MNAMKVWRSGLMALSCCAAWLGSLAAEAAVSTFEVAARGGGGEVAIHVPAGSNQRIIFGSVRSTAQIESFELVDPYGGLAWSGTGQQTRRLTRQEASHPEKGDMYVIRGVQGAVEGTWKLRIKTLRGESGSVVGAYSIRPRFELILPQGYGQGEHGVPTAIEVIPLDNGNAIAGLTSVAVWVEDASGKVVVEAQASGWIRTVLGKDLPMPDGQYVAVVTLSKAGQYVIKARHLFGQAPGQEIIATRPLTIR